MSDLNTTVLKATLGAGYVDDRYTLPKGGSPGDIPVKTEKGVEWQKPEPATSTPDWNQNDPAASDYIKNRPCYAIETEHYQKIDEGTVHGRETSIADKNMPQQFRNAMEFQSPVIGDISVGFSHDSGVSVEHYNLPVYTDDTAVGARKYASADGTVSISRSVTDSSSYLTVPESLIGNTYYLYINMPDVFYVKLADGYIPSTIQRVGADVILPSSTAGSTKKFKLTVDDSGALTATEVTT